MFKNMKIAITPEQPLDEIVVELERLGYKNVNLGHENKLDTIFIDSESKLFCQTIDHTDIKLITLTQLKEMK